MTLVARPPYPMAPRTHLEHALTAADRYGHGWHTYAGAVDAAELDGRPGVGDAVTVTYVRGTGRGRQTVTAYFRPLDPGDAEPRFVGASVPGRPGRGCSWARVVDALTGPAAKVRRAPRGTRPRTRR